MPMKRSPQDILTLQKRGIVSMYPSPTNRRPASQVTLYTPSRIGLNQYTGTGTRAAPPAPPPAPFTAYGVLSNWSGVNFTISRATGSAAFTAEGFFKPTGSTDQTLFQLMTNSGNTTLRISYSYGFVWVSSKVMSGAPSVFFISTDLVLNRWNHVAFSKSTNDTGTLYINGNLVGYAITLPVEGSDIIALGYDPSTGVSAFSGSITNFHFANTRLYSANFTVPSLPLSAVAETSFLLVSTPTGKYTDTSGTNAPITYQTSPTWTAGPITYP